MESFLEAAKRIEISLKQDDESNVEDTTDDFSPLSFFPPNPSNLSLDSRILDDSSAHDYSNVELPVLPNNRTSLSDNEYSVVELPKLPKNLIAEPGQCKCKF